MAKDVRLTIFIQNAFFVVLNGKKYILKNIKTLDTPERRLPNTSTSITMNDHIKNYNIILRLSIYRLYGFGRISEVSRFSMYNGELSTISTELTTPPRTPPLTTTRSLYYP